MSILYRSSKIRKKKKKKEIGNICFSSQESKYFSSNIRQYIFNYILTCLSIYYPSHVIKIILKNLFIFIRCLIVARNSLNFLFILFYIPRDRLRIFISIRSLDRWKARFFWGRSSGSRYFTLQRLFGTGRLFRRAIFYFFTAKPPRNRPSFPSLLEELGSFPRCSHGPATPISSIFYSISEDRTTQTL